MTVQERIRKRCCRRNNQLEACRRLSDLINSVAPYCTLCHRRLVRRMIDTPRNAKPEITCYCPICGENTTFSLIDSNTLSYEMKQSSISFTGFWSD